MKYTHIIFDLDGTFAHTALDLLGTLGRITQRFSLKPISMDQFGQIIGHGAKAMIARSFELNDLELDEKLHDELFDEFLKDYAQNIANETYIFDGLLDAMTKLESDGFGFSICTNKTERMAIKLIETLGVMDRFKSLTGGDTFPFKKPDERHLIETARLAGTEVTNCIMIGDSITDISAAKNANIPSIAVTFGYSDMPVNELGANLVIDHYSKLVDAVGEINA